MKLHNIQISGSIKNNGEDLTQISSSVAATTLDLSNKIAGLSAKTGSVVSGSSQIVYSGITGIPSGIVSGSSQLTGSYDARYVLSGSITQTTWDNIANKPTGIVSGSIQVDLTATTNYSTFSSSISSSIGSLSGSVATTTSGLSSSIGSLSSSVATTTYNMSSSIAAIDSVQNIRLSSLEGVTGSYATTSSVSSLSSSVATTTANLSSSIGSLSSSVATTTSNLSSSLGSISSSISTSIGSLSSSVANSIGTINYNATQLSQSIATTDVGIKSRISAIEGVTGSYATTGSNIFQGNQTITGSLYVSQNLVIGGSSSIQNISSSTLNIGTNLITVNTVNPSSRFGGIAVIDSGSSPQVSGSLVFDSINNQWIFVHQFQSGSAVTSSVMITGPETSNNLGNENGLTQNRLPKIGNPFHLNDSNTVDDGTTIRHLTNTEVTGTLKITGTIVSAGTTLVSGSSQVLNGSGVWSGSAQLPANVVSSSTQVVAYLPSGTVSGSSQVLSGTGIWSGSAQLPSGVVSGSSQIVAGLPSGTVSGSSQVLAGTTIHSGAFFNGISVVSGSGQISFGGITGVPSGLVSGSSQVSFGSISGVPSGLVSGSSQISFGSISGIPSGLVSGSSQISFGSITGVPSGLVSGSSQITLSGTTGFGTYINQALLTTSAPTFAGITSTGNIGVTGLVRTSVAVDTHPTLGTFRFYDGTTFTGGLGTGTWAGLGAANDIVMYLSGVNYIISSGTTALVKVTTSGAVGIGTGTGSVSGRFNVVGFGSGSGWSTYIQNNSKVTTFISHDQGYGLAIDAVPNTSGIYLIKLSSGDNTSTAGTTQRFIVQNNGVIGINNSSPTATLDVVGVPSTGYFSFKGNTSGTGYGGFVNSSGQWVAYLGNGGSGSTTAGSASDFGIQCYQNFILETGGDTERFRVNSSGLIGVNTSSPAARLSVNSGASATYSTVPGNFSYWDSTMSVFGNASSTTGAAVGIGMTAIGGFLTALAPSVAWQDMYYEASTHYFYYSTTKLMSLNSSGNMVVTGNLTAASLTESSSLRYKTNIEKLTYGLSDVMKLKTVRYNRKDNETKEIGLIAEEVFDILPEVVNLNEEGQPDSVSYGRIVSVLIEAIKDLKQEINELKNG